MAATYHVVFKQFASSCKLVLHWLHLGWLSIAELLGGNLAVQNSALRELESFLVSPHQSKSIKPLVGEV